jgi:DNA-binding NtrC family response regulator
VVVVSSDPKIRASMPELLHGCSLKAELAAGIREFKSICAASAPVGCLCGFELADGSFHDAARWLEEQQFQVPLVMVSPAFAGKPPAYFVDALRAGALATLCYPYRLQDVQIVLWSVLQSQRGRH